MKIIKHISASLLCIGLFAGCSKSTHPPLNIPAVTNGSMTATMNGASWTSVKNSAELKIDDGQGISAFVINGETANEYYVFGFDIPNANLNLLVDTHDENMSKDDVVFIYTLKTAGGGTSIQHNTDQGTLNITSVDNVNKRFSGTFSFKLHKIGSAAAADSIKITNGVFTNIAYVVTHQ